MNLIQSLRRPGMASQTHAPACGRTAALMLAGLFATAFLPSPAQAVSLTGVGSGSVDGKEVSARVTFEIVGKNLQITLTNTGTREDYTPAQYLTDVAFSMTGNVSFDLKASSAVVPADAVLYDPVQGKPSNPRNSSQGIVDVSSEWGLATNVTLPNADGKSSLGTYDFAVTAASYDPPLGTLKGVFGTGPDLGGGNKLGGGDFGLINIDSINNNPNRNFHLIVDTVIITLVPDASSDPLFLSMINIDRLAPAFSYGSAHTGIVGIPDEIIPTPAASLAGLIGFGLLGLTTGRRR